jgi:hypothetical protein
LWTLLLVRDTCCHDPAKVAEVILCDPSKMALLSHFPAFMASDMDFGPSKRRSGTVERGAAKYRRIVPAHVGNITIGRSL